MYKWNGRVALVTGASTAIGQAICRALVEGGLTVCAIAKESGVKKLDVSSLPTSSHFHFLFTFSLTDSKHNSLRCEGKNVDICVRSQ